MVQRMSMLIRGIGLAVPPHDMTQEQATELAREVICRTEQQQRVLTALFRKAGVRERHSVLPYQIARNWLPDSPTGKQADRPTSFGPGTAERMRYYAEHAPPLAKQAASEALRTAGVSADEITHIITVTCTGFEAPGIDVALLHDLGLRPTTQRLQIGFMGCHGAINGLRAAQAITQADATARVLLCAVELCSLHYRFNWEPERLVANALFGDGAAAVVTGGPIAKEDDRSWRLKATGSCLIPNSQQAMTWRIGDHGFEMTLDATVPEMIQTHLRPWLATWLDDHGLTLEAIRSWAIHPGGPRILGSIEESLGLDAEATAVSREILAQHGNMSSPTVLFILQRLRELNAPRPCVALGFGPGLFAEAGLFV
jgi:predicted naringenin-chalcone synthase